VRPGVLALICAPGFFASYLAWTAAVADDYDHGFKHVAAMATGILAWLFAAGFIAATIWTAWRSLRARRSRQHGSA
jgi:hypothetical protein